MNKQITNLTAPQTRLLEVSSMFLNDLEDLSAELDFDPRCLVEDAVRRVYEKELNKTGFEQWNVKITSELKKRLNGTQERMQEQSRKRVTKGMLLTQLLDAYDSGMQTRVDELEQALEQCLEVLDCELVSNQKIFKMAQVARSHALHILTSNEKTPTEAGA